MTDDNSCTSSEGQGAVTINSSGVSVNSLALVMEAMLQ